VRALESRITCEITFPRLLGYRYDVADEGLTATFTDESRLTLSTANIPTKTENAPIVGESSIHTLDDLKRRRPNEVAFLLAKLTLENTSAMTTATTSPGSSRNCSALPSAGSPNASRLRTTPSRNCCC
jgi:hypothetical protein